MKEKIFWTVVMIGFFLPICLWIWMVWPQHQDPGTHKLTEAVEAVMIVASYIPIFLAQSALGGCWTYLFFHRKNRPALFWICCSGIAVVLILLILYFMVSYAIWRNDGWLFNIDIGRWLSLILR